MTAYLAQSKAVRFLLVCKVMHSGFVLSRSSMTSGGAPLSTARCSGVKSVSISEKSELLHRKVDGMEEVEKLELSKLDELVGDRDEKTFHKHGILESEELTLSS